LQEETLTLLAILSVEGRKVAAVGGEVRHVTLRAHEKRTLFPFSSMIKGNETPRDHFIVEKEGAVAAAIAAG